MLAAFAAHSESPTPFPPAWDAVIEETFFGPDGEIDPAKLDAYRGALELRRREMRAVLIAHYRDQGRSERTIAKRLKRKKHVWVYDRILGTDAKLGLLDLLWDEVDPNAARSLASTILELSYALKSSREDPHDVGPFDPLTRATLHDWLIEPRSRASHAEREATNLWNSESGLFYEADDLRRLIEGGTDLSRLGPHPGSDFRRPPAPISRVDVREAFYRGGSPLHAGTAASFPHGRALLERVRGSQTQPRFEIGFQIEKSGRSFKLKTGGEIHSEPTVNALLATLGFNVDVTLYVRDFRIDVEDESVQGLRHDWLTHFERRGSHRRHSFEDYVSVGEDEAGPFLIVKEGVIEAKARHVVRVGAWPFGSNGNEGMREARGLGLFSVWIGNTDLGEEQNNKLALYLYGRDRFSTHHLHHDLGHSLGGLVSEQPDALPWDLVRRTATGKIAFRYRSSQPTSLRTAITWADARWMSREIAQLTRRQITDAVALGHWPRPVARLLVEKLIHRRNQLVEAFDLVDEQTPSGKIALLRVDRRLSTPDGSVVEGELVTGRFEGSTDDFDDYWEELLAPLWDRFALFAAEHLQKSVGLVPEIVFDPRSVGLPRGLVAELLVNAKRDVEENSRPTSASDSYLSRDTLLLGARLGGGIVGRGEAAYYRKYTLLIPASSEREARYADDTILGVLLPWKDAKEELPERYVLVRETYLEGRARAITDDLTNGAAFAGAEASLARARLTRDVISVRGDHVRVYRDLSCFDRAAYRAFLKLVLVRIPLAALSADRGEREGELYSIDTRLARDPDATAAAVDAFVRDGDARGLDAVADRIDVSTRFDYRTAWLGLPDLWWREWGAAHDRVAYRDPRAEDPAQEVFTQYERFIGARGSMFELGESHQAVVHTRTPVSAADSETEALEIHLRDEDRSTRSDELAEGPLHFINTLAAAGSSDPRGEGEESDPMDEARERDRMRDESHRARIEFTPSIHSTNQRWGHVQSQVDIGFSAAAVQALLVLDSRVFWAALGTRLGLDAATLAQHRGWLRAHGKTRMVRQRKMRLSLRRTLCRAQRMLDTFASASRESDPSQRNRLLADGLALAIQRRGQGFDPHILASLREVIGAQAISIDARIKQPSATDERLVAGVDLVLHTHALPFRSSRPPIAFQPRTPVELYGMLESLEATVAKVAADPTLLPRDRIPRAPEDDLLGVLREDSEGEENERAGSTGSASAQPDPVANRAARIGLPVRNSDDTDAAPSAGRRPRPRTGRRPGGPIESNHPR